MSFSADIAKYAQKTGLSIDSAVVSVCAQVTTAIIKKSPVDTGRLRGNWYPSIDTPSNETSQTRSEGEAIAQGVATAKQASGKIFWLSNNLDYAYSIEYLRYSSVKAPNGMLRVSVEEAEEKLKRFARS